MTATITGSKIQMLGREDGHSVAFMRQAGALPGLVFVGGFRSDMTGTKADFLADYAGKRGHAYLRFDPLGHGASSGRFEDGTISRWRDDLLAVLDRQSEGPQILVGSSMGAWLCCLAIAARPDRIAGFTAIAPAPDFTERLIRPALSPEQSAALARDGLVTLPSAYGEPTPITRALLADGVRNTVLPGPIHVPGPVRILHGLADPDVPWQLGIKLAEACESPDVTVTLVKDGDHRLSRAPDLARLAATLDGLIEAISASASARKPSR